MARLSVSPSSISYLEQILRKTLPPVPPMRTKGTAASSRGPTAADLNLPQTKQELQYIVYQADLIERLCESASLEAEKVDFNPNDVNDILWFAQMDPAWTFLVLPPVINSEADTRDWVLRVLAHPAITAVRAVRSTEKLPYIASFSGPKGIALPDGIMVDLPVPQEKTSMTYELKTQNAMMHTVFDDLYYACRGKGDGERGIPVLRFWWPDANSTDIKKQTKLFVQVWSQMECHEVDYAVLSSYESTVFFRRHGNTLFMSPTYKCGSSDTLFAMFAFILYALGHLPEETYHIPNLDFWPCNSPDFASRSRPTYAGIDKRLLELLTTVNDTAELDKTPKAAANKTRKEVVAVEGDGSPVSRKRKHSQSEFDLSTNASAEQSSGVQSNSTADRREKSVRSKRLK